MQISKFSVVVKSTIRRYFNRNRKEWTAIITYTYTNGREDKMQIPYDTNRKAILANVIMVIQNIEK